MSVRGWATALLFLLCSSAVQAGAQVVPRPPTRQPQIGTGVRDTIRTRRDSLRTPEDSAAAADTTGVANFLPPDSVMQRLMALPGFSITRYQGEIITFQAATRGASLTTRAIVQRDSQIVKADTILYDGVTQGVQAMGKRSVFVVPGQAAPIVTTGAASYDMAARRIAGTGVRTSIESEGQQLFVSGERYVAVALRDSVRSANDINYYFRNGIVTACDDSIPDYYFKAKEIKRTGSFVVGRPAVLYIGDVPVMWLPFVFQDVRGGRHSGILPPNLGVSDIVRNSPSYRRNVEGLGYYWAMSDYIDAQAFLDWRSSAGQTEQGDPGYMRYNGEMRYRWLDRYVAGNLAFSQTTQGNSRNTRGHVGAPAELHEEQLPVGEHQLRDQHHPPAGDDLEPVLGARHDQLDGELPAEVRTGAVEPGRHETASIRAASQVDRSFPTLSISTSPLSLGSWLSWTPNFSYSASQTLNIDQPSALGLFVRRETSPGATRSSATRSSRTRTRARSRSTRRSRSSDTAWATGSRSTRHATIFPSGRDRRRRHDGRGAGAHLRPDVSHGGGLDPSFTLPSLGRNKFNLTPSVSLSNVDAGGVLDPERANGRRVGASVQAPVVRRLRVADAVWAVRSRRKGLRTVRAHPARHQPTFGYSYAPSADVSDEYLAALGRTKKSATGPRRGISPRSRRTRSTSGCPPTSKRSSASRERHQPRRGREDQAAVGQLHGAELRLRTRARDGLVDSRPDDTVLRVHGQIRPAARRRLRGRLLACSKARRRATRRGSIRFASASRVALRINDQHNPFVVFSRIFGRAVPPTAAGTDRVRPRPDEAYAREVASQPVAGRAARTAAYLPSINQGWEAAFTFTAQRQRPPGGNPSNIVEFDPATRCVQFNTPALRVLFDDCVRAPADESVAAKCPSRRGSPARRSTSRRRRRRSGAA